MQIYQKLPVESSTYDSVLKYRFTIPIDILHESILEVFAEENKTRLIYSTYES